MRAVRRRLTVRPRAPSRSAVFVAVALWSASPLASSAPDEEALGKAAGYPAAPAVGQARQERYIVGSFSAMDRIAPSCELAPAKQVVPLPRAAREPAFRYRFAGSEFTLDDYMARQRVTGLLIVKDGEIVAERYGYARSETMRMLSNSMAKTVVALAVMKALEEGRIGSLDDTAAIYVPALAGSPFGETRIVDLLRMASGVRFVEDYSGQDDLARFASAARRSGTVAALRAIERESGEGSDRGAHFHYASPTTLVLGLIVRQVTGRTLCEYVDEAIWQPLGAEAKATWLVNPFDGIEGAHGGFNATLRDYARLGWMMARDGEVDGRTVVSREHLLDMTDPARQPEAFRPGRIVGSAYGYGFQTWLVPGSHRRFALLGVHGQAILVDPELRLVVVHTAVGKDASGDASGNHLGAERAALFRGIVARYGNW